ncbi:hypothetical protein UT300002_30660 [Clostridium perfringens]
MIKKLLLKMINNRLGGDFMKMLENSIEILVELTPIIASISFLFIYNKRNKKRKFKS